MAYESELSQHPFPHVVSYDSQRTPCGIVGILVRSPLLSNFWSCLPAPCAVFWSLLLFSVVVLFPSDMQHVLSFLNVNDAPAWNPEVMLHSALGHGVQTRQKCI